MRALIACLVIGLGCAHDVRVKMPATDPQVTGALEIVFTRSAHDVTVVIDGQLMVHNEHTQKVRIDGVTAGLVELMVVAGSGQGRVERFQRVEIDVGKTTTIPVAAPERSFASELPQTIVMIAAGIAMRLAYLAIFGY